MQTPIVTFKFLTPEGTIPILKHTLKLLENHFQVQLNEDDTDTIIISNTPDADIQISDKFISLFNKKEFNQKKVFDDKPLIYCENGTPDYLGTCAYMVNYLQEYVNDPTCFDELDRFKYEKSYQFRFSCVRENLVLEYLQKLTRGCIKLQHIKRKYTSTSIWPSHDIDSIFYNVIPELKTASKHFHIRDLWQLIKRLNNSPDLDLFEKIISIDQSNPNRPTFFWLANDQIYTTKSGRLIENANYEISNNLVQRLISMINNSNAELGIHKSLGCQDLAQERDLVDPSISINRNHYLAGKLPQLLSELETIGINRDSTAGFSDAMGFRNSYGLPVMPFDPHRNHPYNVVEYPLHIMDATFIKGNMSPNQAEAVIMPFLKKHQTDCQISVLWHNIYFSSIKYPGWLELYQNIIDFDFV